MIKCDFYENNCIKTASKKNTPANQQGARCEYRRLFMVFYSLILYEYSAQLLADSFILK